MSPKASDGKIFSRDVSNGIFETLFGVPVDDEEIKARGAIRRQQGQVDSRRVEINEAPNRADFIWASLNSLEEAAVLEDGLGSANIGPISDIEELTSILPRFASLSNGVCRLAIGGTCFIEARSAQESYEKINTFVPSLKLNFGTVKDFRIQINRPSDAQLDTGQSIQINRLITLASLRAHISTNNTPFSQSIPQESYLVQLQFDVNTEASNTNIFSSKDIGILHSALTKGIDFVLQEPIS